MILISLLVGALGFHGYWIDLLTMADSFKITGGGGVFQGWYCHIFEVETSLERKGTPRR